MKKQVKNFEAKIRNVLAALSWIIISMLVVSSCVEDPAEESPNTTTEEPGAITRGDGGDSQYYFYDYEGKKVFLSLNTEYAFLSSKVSEPPKNVMQQGVKVAEFKSGNAKGQQRLSKAGVGQFYSELSFEKKLSDKEYLAALSEIKDRNEGILVSPYFNDQYGNKMGLSNFFYVKVKDATDRELLESTAAKNGCVIVEQDAFMPLWYVMSVTEDAELNALEAANHFHESGLFAAAEPDLMADISLNANDEYYPQQWGLENTQQSGGVYGMDIDIAGAWEVSTGGGVTVAVIDEGIDLSHPDLAANIHPLSYDCTNGVSPQILRGAHGTACAGIIGAVRNNSAGIAGVAPDCKLMSVSYQFGINPLGAQQLANGISWAWQNGADVLSNSWTSGVNGSYIADAVNNAIQYGRNGKGCVVVFCAGNENNSVVSYPASLPGVIAVGAMSPEGQRKSQNTSDGEFWWGSNYGSALDLVAPGVLIPTTDIQGPDGYDYTGDYFLNFSGTSSACPHVAGVAALVLSFDPDLRGDDVQNLIQSKCTKLPGYYYNMNGWNNEVGYGLVNASAIFANVVAETSYWIDINNVRHGFSASNTPLTNFCTGNQSITIKGFSVPKNTVKQIVFGNDYSPVNSIGNGFLSGCSALTSVDLSEFTDVTGIGYEFLSDCTALRSVNLPAFDNVTTLSHSFMSGCTSLTSVDLSTFENITSIDYNFLRNCSNLTFVDLSAFSNVTEIRFGFLTDCSSLASVDLSSFSNVETVGWEFMKNCTSLASIDLSALENITTIHDDFLLGCTSLTSIIGLSELSNVTSIGNGFLYWCISLQSVDLSGFTNVTSIGDFFLAVCVSLPSVDMSAFTSVTTIGDFFLDNCSALTSVDLSTFGNVTSIGYCFLSMCNNLTSIQLGGVNWSNKTVNSGIALTNTPTCKLYANSQAIASAFKAKIPEVSNWSVVIN